MYMCSGRGGGGGDETGALRDCKREESHGEQVPQALESFPRAPARNDLRHILTVPHEECCVSRTSDQCFYCIIELLLLREKGIQWKGDQLNRSPTEGRGARPSVELEPVRVKEERSGRLAMCDLSSSLTALPFSSLLWYSCSHVERREVWLTTSREPPSVLSTFCFCLACQSCCCCCQVNTSSSSCSSFLSSNSWSS